MPFDSFDHLPLTEARETIKEDDVSRVLRRAAEIMRKRGSCRGTPRGRKVCMMKAVTLAEGKRLDANFLSFGGSPAFPVLAEYIRKIDATADMRVRTEIVWGYNDCPQRTHEQRIAALEGAADTRARAALRGE